MATTEGPAESSSSRKPLPMASCAGDSCVACTTSRFTTYAPTTVATAAARIIKDCQWKAGSTRASPAPAASVKIKRGRISQSCEIAGRAPSAGPRANISALLLALRPLVHRIFLFSFSPALALNRLTVGCKRYPAGSFFPVRGNGPMCRDQPIHPVLRPHARPWVCDFSNCT